MANSIKTPIEKIISAIALIGASAMMPSITFATPFVNPDPLNLSEDLNDSGYFSATGSAAIALGYYNLGSNISLEFGLFSASNPLNLIPVFESSDLSGEQAVIDFNGGFVHDIEDNNVQNSFNPISVFGFYLTVFDQNLTTLTQLYSDPLLNGVVGDSFATHQSLTDDTKVMIFYTANSEPLSLQVVTGIVPVSEPRQIPLILTSLGLLALHASKRKYVQNILPHHVATLRGL
ncbi:MAG TPA: hypothetical protein DCF45_01655 [Gammaproteobacteria bacterium]|nr:hypothetical protein [Gammaproteobacteria bacterium]